MNSVTQAVIRFEEGMNGKRNHKGVEAGRN